MAYNTLGDIQTLLLTEGVSCDNQCVILTLDNDVIIMGDLKVASAKANTTLATLFNAMTPEHDIKIPVIVNESEITVLTVSSESTISCSTDLTDAILRTNGVTFNVSDRYYNSRIGNNFSQGTSPLNGAQNG